jgi:catalase
MPVNRGILSAKQEQGIYDMVGNNTPVFFIRDPLKFQHFIRSKKRRADRDLRDHDMKWDFRTLSFESAYQVTWLVGMTPSPHRFTETRPLQASTSRVTLA